MRRHLLIFVFILTALLTLSSCYPGDADYYETRFDELDINGRVNEVALAIENDKVVPRTFGELKAIVEDLNTINTHENDVLNGINSDFISAVKMLNISAEKRQEDDDGYLAYYDMAKEQYNAANTSLNRYKRTLESLA